MSKSDTMVADQQQEVTNFRVVLIHKNAPDEMIRNMSRVISGAKLSGDYGARCAQAKELYNKMMGIKSAGDNDYRVVETTEQPTAEPEPLDSSAGVYQRRQDDGLLDRFSKMLAAGIAQGVAEAMKVRDQQDRLDEQDQPVSKSASCSRKVLRERLQK